MHELVNETETASLERMNNFEFDILSRMNKLENGLDSSLQKIFDAMDMQQQRNENNSINASVVDATERTSTSSAPQEIL